MSRLTRPSRLQACFKFMRMFHTAGHRHPDSCECFERRRCVASGAPLGASRSSPRRHHCEASPLSGRALFSILLDWLRWRSNASSIRRFAWPFFACHLPNASSIRRFAWPGGTHILILEAFSRLGCPFCSSSYRQNRESICDFEVSRLTHPPRLQAGFKFMRMFHAAGDQQPDS